MQTGPPRRRRARPVADAPIDALLLRAEDLAKGWLLALVEQAPLEDARQILAAELARDGPRVCDATVRALADDTDLRRIEPGGALEPLVARAAELSGARSSEAAALAVDALQAVVWSALREELSDPDPGYVLALAERTALVSEVIRGAVLRRAEEVGSGGIDGERGPLRVAPEPPEPEPDPGAGPPPELRDTSSAPRVSRGTSSRPALWMGAVEDEIARAEVTGTPLSVLVVELEEAERLAAARAPSDATATFGRFAQAVRSVMRRHDVLACETDSRAWIIARETGRAGARALGSRVARAVRASDAWAGAPLTVSIGVAVLGEEGRDASELIGAAEEAKFAAAASGVGITGGPDDSPLAG
jgi:GGDEF domain-containing protein